MVFFCISYTSKGWQNNNKYINKKNYNITSVAVNEKNAFSVEKQSACTMKAIDIEVALYCA